MTTTDESALVSAVTAMTGEPAVALDTHQEVDQFYVTEARLLDAHRYSDWLALFTADARYWVPVRRNTDRRSVEHERSARGDVALYDDDLASLAARVQRMEADRIAAGTSPPHTRHMVANVWARHTEVPEELRVDSNILVYRNRGATDVDVWTGWRDDLLRRGADGRWRIADRTVTLDQSVVLSRDLAVFF